MERIEKYLIFDKEKIQSIIIDYIKEDFHLVGDCIFKINEKGEIINCKFKVQNTVEKNEKTSNVIKNFEERLKNYKEIDEKEKDFLVDSIIHLKKILKED